MRIVLDHAVRILVLAGDPAVCCLHVGAEVHPCRVPPAEERLAGILLAGDEVLCGSKGLLVDGLHSLLGQRAGVLDGLAALAVRLGT